MTAWIFADAGSTTLAAPISTTPTPGTTETWSLTSTTGSPPLPQPTSGQRYGVTILPPGGDANPEVVVVTEVLNGTQVVVLRGMGTNGVVKTHSIGDTFSNTIPAGFLNGAAQALVVTQQAGATYTFALADAGTVVESTYATGATFTIPLNSSVAFAVPTEITALDGPGSGVLTVTGAAGVTVNGVSGGSVATTGAYQAITLIQTAANVWIGTAAGSGAVSSVFTRTGAVSARSGDYTVAQITGAAALAGATFTGELQAAVAPVNADDVVRLTDLVTFSAVIPTTGIPSNTVGQNGDVAMDFASGLVYQKTSGAWVQLVLPSLISPYYGIAGAILASSVPNATNVGDNVLSTTGVPFMQPIILQAGQVIGHLTFKVGVTAAVTPTHWWLAVANSSRVQVANTADQTTTALGAYSTPSLAIAGIVSGAATSYVVPTTGLYYVVQTIVAATMPSMLGITGPVATLAGPNQDSGVTAPPSYPHTYAALNLAGPQLYAEVSA